MQLPQCLCLREKWMIINQIWWMLLIEDSLILSRSWSRKSTWNKVILTMFLRFKVSLKCFMGVKMLILCLWVMLIKVRLIILIHLIGRKLLCPRGLKWQKCRLTLIQWARLRPKWKGRRMKSPIRVLLWLKWRVDRTPWILQEWTINILL